MPRPLRRLSTLLASAAFLALPALAYAGGTEKCIAASEHAQELRNAGKLAAARDELAVCGNAECPKIIQTDCARWMSEILGSIPTVVPAAKDTSGRDIVEARLLVDGKVVAESLDGKSVAVDPGAHLFRFEAAGKNPQEERIAVRAGEQNRIVVVTLTAAPPPPPPPPSNGVATEPAPRSRDEPAAPDPADRSRCCRRRPPRCCTLHGSRRHLGRARPAVHLRPELCSG